MYFGILALARFTLLLVVAFTSPLVASSLHPLPLNAFMGCGLVKDLRLQVVPGYVGTAFGVCFYATHVGRCRS